MVVLFQDFAPNGGELLVEVVVLAPDAVVVARAFHILLFEEISSTLPFVPQSVPSTLMVLLSVALSLKACDDSALVFSFFMF